MSRFLVVILLLAASLASAQTVTTIPAVPAAGEALTIEINGIWRDSCFPWRPRIQIGSNREIFLTYTLEGHSVCFSAVQPWHSNVALPKGLTAGRHTVRARLIDGSGVVELFTREITISGQPSEIESITPSWDTHGGNRVVRIRGSFGSCDSPQVTIGGVPAEAERIAAGVIDAVVPLNTNVGVVDIHVRCGEVTYHLPSGFQYVSIEQLEKVLLPVFARRPVPGAHGSLWQSELRVVNRSPIALIPNIDTLFIGELPPRTVSRPTPLFPHPEVDSPPAAMMYVFRDVAPTLSYQLRLRDLSRENETWGTEIPVVRSSEMRASVTLVDVPLRDGFRQMLRLYIPEYAACCNTQVRFFSESGELLAERSINLELANGTIGGLAPAPYVRDGSRQLMLQPAYAQLDLGTIPELEDHETVWITAHTGAARMWAFVSVTHDETQHVTTISPQ